MKSIIFVIEDVPEMSELVALYLTKAQMEPRTFQNAEDALSELENGTTPDLVVLDLNLPGMSGFDFLKKFRANYNTTIPVVIVSARDADEDIINGLGIGADEFVTKPFSPRVLVARIESVLRRQATTTAAAEETVKFGEFTLLLNSCVLKKGAVKVPLSTKEYLVLECMIKHAGEPLTPEKIYNEVWKSKFGDITAVAVYIQRLRKKIEKNPSEPVYLKTVYGFGYTFDNSKIVNSEQEKA